MELEAESSVVNAHAVQDYSVAVVEMNRILDNVVAEVIGFEVMHLSVERFADHPAYQSRTTYPIRCDFVLLQCEFKIHAVLMRKAPDGKIIINPSDVVRGCRKGQAFVFV